MDRGPLVGMVRYLRHRADGPFRSTNLFYKVFQLLEVGGAESPIEVPSWGVGAVRLA